MTAPSEMLERAAWKICTSHLPEHKRHMRCKELCGGCLADARAVLEAIQDSGIPIDKLLSGEYVAAPKEWLIKAGGGILQAHKAESE